MNGNYRMKNIPTQVLAVINSEEETIASVKEKSQKKLK